MDGADERTNIDYLLSSSEMEAIAPMADLYRETSSVMSDSPNLICVMPIHTCITPPSRFDVSHAVSTYTTAIRTGVIFNVLSPFLVQIAFGHTARRPPQGRPPVPPLALPRLRFSPLPFSLAQSLQHPFGDVPVGGDSKGGPEGCMVQRELHRVDRIELQSQSSMRSYVLT